MYFYTGFFRFCLNCSGRSKIGVVILSQALGQVPSAQVGLTSLFGMGRGDPHRNKRHKGIKQFIVYSCQLIDCMPKNYLLLLI